MRDNIEMTTPSFARIPTRVGERPETAKEGPHSQLTQNASEAVWHELVAQAFDIPVIKQGRSSVSMADSLAGLLSELPQQHGPWSLATVGPVEVFHIHGVVDSSMHAVLPSSLAWEVIEKGWGEPHTYADFDTQVMLYAPRNENEIAIIVGFLAEGVNYAISELGEI